MRSTAPRIPRPDTDVARLIGKLRAAGYSAPQLAGYLGVTAKTMLRYERDRADMRWHDYERLVELVKRVEKGSVGPLPQVPVRPRRRKKKPESGEAKWSEVLASLGAE